MKNNTYIAQTSVSPQNAKIVVETVKDLSQINGFGMGVGLVGLVAIGAILFVVYKIFNKIDINKIIDKAGEFSDKTTESLNNLVAASAANAESFKRTGTSLSEIAEITSGTDRRVTDISGVVKEVRELQDKTVQLGNDMSGKLDEIQRMANESGRDFTERLNQIESHLRNINDSEPDRSVVRN